MFGGKRGGLQAEEHHPNHEAGGTGALHTKKWHHEEENYVDILKQHLKTSVRKLKLGCKWVFQMDNGPKHTSLTSIL